MTRGFGRVSFGAWSLTAIAGTLALGASLLDAQSPPAIQPSVDAAYAKFKTLNEGKNADYIPALAKVDPNLFGVALVPDLILYLEIDLEHLVPRVLAGKGMNYWESGMHLALGTDIFESFDRYQRRLLEEYDRLADEFRFVRVDARRSVEEIQNDLRAHIAQYLATAGQLAVAPPADAGASRGR